MPGRSSIRPSLDSMRQRLSGVFSINDVPKLKIADAQRPSISLDARTEPEVCWRPVPFALLGDESRDVYFIKNDQEVVEIVDSDKAQALFHTNLPPLSKASVATMPAEVELIPTGNEEPNTARLSPITINKIGDDLSVHIKGLEPVKFYRARPDCIFPVDCFAAKQAARPSTVAAGIGKSTSQGTTVEYAWKNTSMVGKGGLKLVDLRDNEVLAYFEWTNGRSFAKVHLQGSGLRLMKLVVATIVALKYKHVMRAIAPSEETSSMLSKASGSIWSLTYSC